MMKRTLKDNYNATKQGIARRVLASPLAQFFGYPSDEDRLTVLSEIAAGDFTHAAAYSFMRGLEFRACGTSCDISVDVEGTEWRRSEDRLDDEGNEWRQYTLTCKVNFPCHGSTDTGTLMARLEFYRQVTLFAAMLQAEFGGTTTEIWKMTATKAEVAERNLKAEQQRLKSKIDSIVDGYRGGMRVNGAHGVSHDAVEGIPVGVFIIERDDRGTKKTYSFTVNKPDSVYGASLVRLT